MERSVRVNAGNATGTPQDQFQIHPTGKFTIEPPSEEEFGVETGRTELAPPTAGDQGPCLYLGPRGERCGRRAVRDGFCANHLPGAGGGGAVGGAAGQKASGTSKKALAVLAMISGILWPYIADIVREILRWIHSH